jgi:DNA modification methylase
MDFLEITKLAQQFYHETNKIALAKKITLPKSSQVWQGDVFNLSGSGIKFPLILADCPYGSAIVNEAWDQKWDHTDYLKLAKLAEELLEDGGSFYCWGGIGKPHKRHFFKFLSEVENETGLTLHNLITWSKRRGYGTQSNYLFTREECAFLIKGKKPRIFNVPLLPEKRVGKSWNPKYPALSEYKRRTNVWVEPELLMGKRHVCEKPHIVNEIPIEVHTKPGDFILDLFSGSGSAAEAAKKLNRKFISVEMNKGYASNIAKNLSVPLKNI